MAKNTTGMETSLSNHAQDICDNYNSNVGKLNEEDGIDCPKCLNKGNILVVQNNEPATMDCECMIKRRSFKRIKLSGLGSLLDKRVNDYVANEIWQKEVKGKATAYINSKSRNWFVMLGQSGSGKTHICSAITSHLLNQGKEVRYVIWTDLAAKIREMDGVNVEIEEFKDVEILYIDDLFKVEASKGQKNAAFKIINHRANNSLVTIISSEMLFDELLVADEAIAGRIKHMAGDFLINITRGDKNYRLKRD